MTHRVNFSMKMFFSKLLSTAYIKIYTNEQKINFIYIFNFIIIIYIRPYAAYTYLFSYELKIN